MLTVRYVVKLYDMNMGLKKVDKKFVCHNFAVVNLAKANNDESKNYEDDKTEPTDFRDVSGTPRQAGGLHIQENK